MEAVFLCVHSHFQYGSCILICALTFLAAHTWVTKNGAFHHKIQLNLFLYIYTKQIRCMAVVSCMCALTFLAAHMSTGENQMELFINFCLCLKLKLFLYSSIRELLCTGPVFSLDPLHLSDYFSFVFLLLFVVLVWRCGAGLFSRGIIHKCFLDTIRGGVGDVNQQETESERETKRVREAQRVDKTVAPACLLLLCRATLPPPSLPPTFLSI